MWKQVRSKAKVKRKTKLAMAVLAVLLGFLLLSGAVNLGKSLFVSQRPYTWNGQFNFNLLIRSKDLSVFSFSPKEKSITVLNLPDETFLEVPFGFGKWQLRSVYQLGGDNLLVSTLTSFLAVPIDGFVDFGPESLPASEIINTFAANPLSGFNLFSSLKTDVSLWELLKLKLGITAVRFDKVKTLDLKRALDQDSLPDGSQVLVADPVKLDAALADLADPIIVSEHKSIAVFNATDKPGLANKWARLVTNLGGNVIIVANSESKLEKTQVRGEKSAVLERLQQIFAPDGKISSQEDLAPSRAQVNIYLGEDFEVK